MPPGWDDAWAVALDALELDCSRAEELLTGDHLTRPSAASQAALEARWTPPVGLPPLPPSMADRARTLLHRQVTVGAALATAAAATRRQALLAARLGSTPAAAPVLVDRPA